MNHIESLTSQCVVCGLCSTTCPTYQESHNENRSPRGRIALIRALANNDLELDDHLEEHLSTCLHCFSCMKACPSQVNYAEIIHYADSQLLFKGKKKANLSSLAQSTLTETKFRQFSGSALKLLYKVKLIPILKSLSKSRLLAYLPDKFTSIKSDTTLDSKYILQTGCTNQLINPKLIQDSISLLRLLNIEAQILENEACCGAIKYRQGLPPEVHQQLNQDNKHYLSLNTSCSAHLKEFGHARTDELLDFLLEQKEHELKQLAFNYVDNHVDNHVDKHANKKVLWHASCTSRNRLKAISPKTELEKLIPGLQIQNMPELSCCGASGTYMLEHPELAENIASPYIDFIQKNNIEVLLSTDISCALHLKQQCENNNYPIEVIHPISFMIQCL